MSVIDFPELQKLSGCRQVNKVVDWLKVSKIPHVIGYDGKPRTTHQWLEVWQKGDKDEQQRASEIRFKV